MANFDATKAIFVQADTNHDGSIDRNEFQKWASNVSGLSSSSYESLASGTAFNSNTTGHTEANAYDAGSQTALDATTGGNTSYAAASIELAGDASIQTNNAQQTKDYLSQPGHGVYNDPNPQIVRRPATIGPITYQQKIFVRFLQPPPLPPPGPLIIKEVRPPQPPPPPPLVVRQRPPPLPSPPPLILRERPPPPPPPILSQTVIRRLNAVPVPPRSVVIERLPPLPPKPRDIIIERWIPYEPLAKRRTIVQRAPPPVQYPQPRNVIVIYDTIQARVVRQFQRLGVTQENPQTYVARYGATLLDAATLIEEARSAGVVEDISPPAVSPSTQSTSSVSFSIAAEGTTTGFDSTSLDATGFEGLRVIDSPHTNIYNLEATNNGNAQYSPTNFASDSALTGITTTSTGAPKLDVAAASFVAADTNRDGRLDRAEFQRFMYGGL